MTNVTTSIIAAVSANNVIGDNGNIPWNFPEDQQNFKELTLGCPIVMGRETWESLPHYSLKNRFNYVITSKEEYAKDSWHLYGRGQAWGPFFFNEIDEAMKDAREVAKLSYRNEIFVIGGQNIYEQVLDRVDRIYLTRILKKYKGNRYFHFPPEDFRINNYRRDNATIDDNGDIKVVSRPVPDPKKQLIVEFIIHDRRKREN